MHYGDEIVFDAQAKNAPPKDGEEQGHTYLFALIQVRKEGHYRSFLVDGVHPGDAPLQALREAITALGGVLSVRSDETYQLDDPEGDDKLPGLFAFLAWPADRPVIEAHDLLSRAAEPWPHPLVWPGIVQELGFEEEMGRQAELIERYGL
ncbi:MAG: hypothetical protein ABI193_13335, partial [Minicystis sp.]